MHGDRTIRAASSSKFDLGFLRRLSRLRLLTAFDYLSTVSGGGYIGCWLSAWIHRHPDGFAGVMEEPVAGPMTTPRTNLRRYGRIAFGDQRASRYCSISAGNPGLCLMLRTEGWYPPVWVIPSGGGTPTIDPCSRNQKTTS